MLVISALGWWSGRLLQRYWLQQREASWNRARIHAGLLSHKMPDSEYDGLSTKNVMDMLYGRSSHAPSMHEPERPPTAMTRSPTKKTRPMSLPPTASSMEGLHASHGDAATAMEPLVTIPTVPEENHRLSRGPSEPTSHHSVSFEDHGMNETSSPALQTRTSLRAKFSLSRGPPLTLREKSQRLSQGMLSRFPSQFRSARNSRRLSQESGESIGMPDHKLPMARRLPRKERRFQYDSSSYASSMMGKEDERASAPAPQQELVASPAPVMLPSRESPSDELLHARIKAWQESSIEADVPEDAQMLSSATPYGPTSHTEAPAALGRSLTRSSARSAASAYSTADPNDMAAGAAPTLPSVLPPLSATADLENWLRWESPLADDARTRSSYHSPVLLPETRPSSRLRLSQAMESKDAMALVPATRATLSNVTVSTSPMPLSSTPQRRSGGEAPVSLQVPGQALAMRSPSPLAPASSLGHDSASSAGHQRPLSFHTAAHMPRTPSPLVQRVDEEPGMQELPSLADVPMYLGPMDDAPQGARVSHAPSSSSRSSFPTSARMSGDHPRRWTYRSNATLSTEITWPEDASTASKDGPPSRHNSDRSQPARPGFTSEQPYLMDGHGHERAPTATTGAASLSTPLQTMQAWFRSGGE